jgi:hypothetical protein
MKTTFIVFDAANNIVGMQLAGYAGRACDLLAAKRGIARTGLHAYDYANTPGDKLPESPVVIEDAPESDWMARDTARIAAIRAAR